MYRRFAATWLFVLIFFIALLPSLSLAEFPERIVPCDGVDCTVCDISTLAQNVLNTGIYIAIFFSAIMFAWAGWLHVTAGGSEGKVREARGIFTNVLLGLIIILVGWLVVDTLLRVVLNDSVSAVPEGLLRPWEPICG